MGRGNIQIHSQAEQRWLCTLCGRTFSVRRGTPFYRCRVDPQVIVQVVTLVAYGCPIAAIQAAFGFQGRTVRRWVEAAGEHCRSVHAQLVEQPRPLGQVQADELRAKLQGEVRWLAMAVAVPFRLWLGGVVSAQRDQRLIRALAQRVRACAQPGPLLVCMDGLAAYVRAFRQALRTPVRTGQARRPRLVPWPDVVLAQVLKQRQGGRVVAVERRLVQGKAAEAKGLLVSTQRGGVVNTAYVERLNATWRARLAVLGRRTRALARRAAWLEAALYLIGSVYNFCTEHASLTLAEGKRRTPAMAAGITDHCWRVAELLWYRVPPPRWTPPKRRGRRSRALKALIEQWCT